MMFADIEESSPDNVIDVKPRWRLELLALAIAVVPISIGGVVLSLSYLGT